MGKNVPYVATLSPEDRRELEGHIQVFLDEKKFEGCDGVEITDEVRVTVAAQACVLLLHRETDFFPEVSSILIYPHTYTVPSTELQPDGSLVEGESARLGESWHRGAVVLAWDSVLSGASDIHDGHNVVFHEFAHQLDEEDGAANGAPHLPRSQFVAWARVLGHDFRELHESIEHHRRTILDPYGATNPAEFFAVATECFFEKSVQLRRKHPELYGQLQLYYKQDPAGRTSHSLRDTEAASRLVRAERLSATMGHPEVHMLSIKRLAPAVVLALAGCSSLRVQTDYDHNVLFDQFKTFAFANDPHRVHSDKPVAGEESLVNNSIVRARVRDAISANLAAKGLRLVDKDPDVLVAFYVSARPVTTLTRDYSWGGDYGYGFDMGYGCGFGYGHENDPWDYGYRFEPISPELDLDIRNYEEGTLLIDLIAPKDKRLLWRGRGERDVDHASELIVTGRIKKTVNAIMAKFPPNG